MLHNFIISERLLKNGTIANLKEEISQFDALDSEERGYLKTPVELQQGGFSFVREALVARIKSSNLTCPAPVPKRTVARKLKVRQSKA